MAPMDNKTKQLYDALVNAIVSAHMQRGNLTQDEMYCLLSLLDLAMLGKDEHGFIPVLREWQACVPDPEVDEIIKATLLNIDFKKPASVQSNLETIRDLIRYNKKLRDSGSSD